MLFTTTAPGKAFHNPGPDVDHDVYFARESLQDGLRTGVATDVQSRLAVQACVFRLALPTHRCFVFAQDG